MEILKLIKKRFIKFNGAMGTIIKESKVDSGELPKLLNITHPETIIDIHRKYVKAGSHVVSTNTFQANDLKLANCGYSVEEIVDKAVSNAKMSGAKYVALDVGPSGKLMEPLGDLSFDQAYHIFKRQMVAGEKAGADLILIETFSDLLEAKVAILAAKENTSLPVIVSMTYEEDGRTFTGTDPITATLTLQELGIDGIGVNCSMGPKELMPIAMNILKYSKLPVIVQANAGLPRMDNGKTYYTIDENEYSQYAEMLLDAGVRIIGGCCGTTPKFIEKIKEISAIKRVRDISPFHHTCVTSNSKTVFLDNNITVIGERINPTGKPKLKEALRDNKIEYIINEAIDQSKAGADILDINVGLPEIDEPALMARVVRKVQRVCDLPLQIDSADPLAIEIGVRVCNGRPIINSVNGKHETMERIFPIVKKYGALVVGLTLDENGIPSDAEGRFSIAEKIVNTANDYGIPKENILIDCLTLTASAQQKDVLATIEAIKMVKARLGVKTVLGVSNVSFGLPSRELLNSVFLAVSIGAGLDAAILNPLSHEMMKVIDSCKVINCQDLGCENYVLKYKENIEIEKASLLKETSIDSYASLIEMIIDGKKEEVSNLVTKLLEKDDPLLLIDNCFIPALNQVGDGFERGEVFLPSLMMSAEAVRSGFEIIKSFSNDEEPVAAKGKVLMATVLGDIHDIGKNIAKMLLENYGYQVFDLGKDVPIDLIIKTIKENSIELVGLSALMTTTVKNMRETINAIRDSGLDCKIMVGGAVLNKEYADFVGADYYVKDARDGIVIAKEVLG